MTPRLIASDLDGTLLRDDLTVSTRSVVTLDRLEDEEIPFVMVTGRPIRWLPAVFEYTGVRGPVICANGAVVYDPVRDEILHHTTLDVDTVREVIAAMRQELPEVIFAVEVDHGREMLSEPTWPSIGNDLERRFVQQSELTGAPAVKLLARLPDGVPDDFVGSTTKLLDSTVQVTSSSRQALVEISALGVTKASGLAWLAERWEIHSDQVVAYGDMPNDVPMVTWAGTGVAVANAHPALLEVADEMTGANQEDGVAVHVDRLLSGAVRE